MADFLSLEAAKAHLNEDGNSDIDVELQGFIDASVEVVEDLTGEVLVRREFEQTVHLPVPAAAVWLARVPAAELVSVASADGTATWDVDDLTLTPPGQLIVMAGGLLHGTLRVRYEAGLDEGWPAKRVMAAKMLVLHWWQTQRTSYGGAATSYGGSDGDGPTISPGYAVPRSVSEMLGPRTPNIP